MGDAGLVSSSKARLAGSRCRSEEKGEYPVFTLARLHPVLEAALLVRVVGLAGSRGRVDELLPGGRVVQADPHSRADKEKGTPLTTLGGCFNDQ